MDREGFRNRLKQYKEAKGFDPQLKYWEWKQKYDSAPQPDSMPSQPQSDQSTVTSQPLDDRAHRWDNEHYVDPVNTVFDADRHRSWKEPAQKTFGKGRVKFTYRDFMKPADVKHMKFLQSIGRLGNTLKGASIFGEVVQNLFPSEEAELIEDLRVKMDKQNKWLTGQEDIPKYDEGGEVTGPPTYEQWNAEMNQYNPTILDNASMYWSIEAAKKALHNEAMKLPGYAERWTEYHRSLPKVNPDINEFVDELWANENPNNAGLKNGKYYPHKSPEGGKSTIGPGFKIGSGSHRITKKQAERGMTKARLNQEARYIGKQHLNAVDQFINYGQTTNPADTVSPQIKMGLMDLKHQVGPLNEWGNLRQAVLNGDLEGIRKESTVTWNDNGKTKVDKRRKKIRDEKYFYYE